MSFPSKPEPKRQRTHFLSHLSGLPPQPPSVTAPAEGPWEPAPPHLPHPPPVPVHPPTHTTPFPGPIPLKSPPPCSALLIPSAPLSLSPTQPWTRSLPTGTSAPGAMSPACCCFVPAPSTEQCCPEGVLSNICGGTARSLHTSAHPALNHRVPRWAPAAGHLVAGPGPLSLSMPRRAPSIHAGLTIPSLPAACSSPSLHTALQPGLGSRDVLVPLNPPKVCRGHHPLMPTFCTKDLHFRTQI